MYNKILVPLNGSRLSEAALPHAQTLASAEETELFHLKVSVNSAAEFSFSDPSIVGDIMQEMATETLPYMQSARAKMQRARFRSSF